MQILINAVWMRNKISNSAYEKVQQSIRNKIIICFHPAPNKPEAETREMKKVKHTGKMVVCFELMWS